MAQQHRGAAEAVEIVHRSGAARGEVARHGRFPADRLDVAQGEIDPGLEGEGEDAVGRTADRGECGGGVDESGAGEDVAGRSRSHPFAANSGTLARISFPCARSATSRSY